MRIPPDVGIATIPARVIAMTPKRAGAVVGRGLAGLTLVAAVVVASAAPAHAHAADADRATNYETTLVSAPDVPGLHVRLLNHGTQIEVTYDGDDELIVLGYADEPYLRIGPDGVDQNLESYATYQNTSLTQDAVVPPEINHRNPPRWEHISDEPTARWHDHRAHWMGVVTPDPIRENPGQGRVVMDDEVVPLLIGGVDGERVEIVVDVSYVPPPALWPWVTALIVGIGGIVALGWVLGPRPVSLVVGGSLVVVTLFDLVTAVTESPVAPPAWWLVAVGGAGLVLVVGLARAVRASRGLDALTSALLGGSGLALAGLLGVIDRNWLVRSELPTDLAPGVARAMVVASIVLGVELAALALVASLRPVASPTSGAGAPQPSEPLAAVS